MLMGTSSPGTKASLPNTQHSKDMDLVGHEDDEQAGTPPPRRQAERAEVVQPAEQWVWREPRAASLKRAARESERDFLHRTSGRIKGKGFKKEC